jgi:hypothetical protein
VSKIMTDYWTTCIEEALGEANLFATPEQVAKIANFVSIAHDMYGEANGYDCIPNPLKLENDELHKQIKVERAKVVCPDCGGRGRIIGYGGTRVSDSPCDKCHGEGYV